LNKRTENDGGIAVVFALWRSLTRAIFVQFWGKVLKRTEGKSRLKSHHRDNRYTYAIKRSIEIEKWDQESFFFKIGDGAAALFEHRWK
jgi:hypothetical protein